jgi:membrane-bound ClpP family serine protease
MEFMALLGNITWLSILLFVIGIFLIVVELYVPGVGVPGIVGTISLIALILVTGQNAVQRIILASILLVICVLLFLIFFVFLSKRRIPKSLILETSEEGFAGTADNSCLVGDVGIVLSTCRPVGNVDFDGKKLDVVSRGEFINEGATVEIIEVEGNRIVVKEKSI